MAVDVPVVLTIKFNGKVLAERTSLLISPGATWEAVARRRLEAVPGVDAESYLGTPLTVSLFRSADALPSDLVGAAISDPVGAGYALGYAFAVLNFTAPVHGCARPATVGTNPFTTMMGDAAASKRPIYIWQRSRR